MERHLSDERRERPIRIGISACLLGQSVRFDGGHKRNTFLTETLGRFVDWVPVCPEIECGLGTPREAMRLVRGENGVQLLTVKSGVDLTARMEHFSHARVSALVREELSGYVLKKDSPSCGLERVKVYDRHGAPQRSGRGLFAKALVDAFPLLPIEDEGRLTNPLIRDKFVERVFAYWRLRILFTGRWTRGALVRFHTAHKLLLMAHAPDAYRRLGWLVAGRSDMSRRDLERCYSTGFMQALAHHATRCRHTNVLQHMAGYFKDRSDAASKRELGHAIEDYRRGHVPLLVPLTLVRHHLRVHDVRYLAQQIYLEPYPKELMLRPDAAWTPAEHTNAERRTPLSSHAAVEPLMERRSNCSKLHGEDEIEVEDGWKDPADGRQRLYRKPSPAGAGRRGLDGSVSGSTA